MAHRGAYCLLISAFEPSADRQSAPVISALKEKAKKAGQELRIFGLGGPEMVKAGLDLLIPLPPGLAVMGIMPVLRHLSEFFRIIRQVEKAVAQVKPGLVLMVDFPDFHFQLARRLFHQKVPLFYYIPPKVWVWRAARISSLKKYFKKLFCIFPFEEAFFCKQGLAAEYVGNPLLAELPFSLSQTQARAALGLEMQKNDLCLSLMPGSRAAELKRHFELFLTAAALAAEHLLKQSYLGLEPNRRLFVLLALLEGSKEGSMQAELKKRFLLWKSSFLERVLIQRKPELAQLLEFRLFFGGSHTALIAADAALVKSGTSTLEAALLDCPQVVVYRAKRTEFLIFRLLSGASGPVSLVNLLLGRKNPRNYCVPEYVGPAVSAEELSQAVFSLLTEKNKVSVMRAAYRDLRESFFAGNKEAPAERLAALLWEALQEKPREKAGAL